MASHGNRPTGCGPLVASIYYKLCDLDAAWGVVLEALASAGAVVSFVLFIALLANVPFMRDRDRRNAVALHAVFLVCTVGLFGLTFACIVEKNFSTCASRRFLFGVLFAGCFSCLLVQGVRLNALVRGRPALRAGSSCLAALALWSVEVLINAEWLIITVVRNPQGPGNSTALATPCNVANADFVMALIYVMALLVATLGAGLGVLAGKHKQWKKDAALILACAFLSICIWVAWIAMYVHGNVFRGVPHWDDPTLGVALVANAWVFLTLITIPQVCLSSGDGDDGPDFAQDAYPSRGVDYENILKENSPHNVFADNMENKAFSMEEPGQGAKVVSPYSGYTGQLRSCVYQPTELALISKTRGASNSPEAPYDSTIPRASAHSTVGASVVTDTVNGNTFHRTPHW
ncbi:G-protein coupled receptor family C group 5 member C [Corythoichthys intestinalis]|uniref:G-protein coupled receptor family C group 5 member C n=1 Tax=Corythoichthys intestinalis TaxID=161448 RepID=UPI0025A4DDF6|nr:G-protein coupled receptor family C group 5 member C [Corythoichthys intestinalis]XP_057682069.1 G-protein coupled receptor family C group 5 member C [Corythoichthys intestinalis]XP_057682070.1 G-protein coupled receptor family C group 5 member C [Corythoichthys intestinalis]XP_057682073.1 G-protein coupled receptor family C group 5 member C [Corythoichthys intestinalis]XP_057682074.1 G-protein coupled receptor family C group 5 member C [Corythoichthys intestinalis]XP_057682075.1 G-protein 